MGRHVKKGERGISILAPFVATRTNAKNEAGEQVEKALVGVKPVTVFDESQTEGRPTPELSTVTGDPGKYTDRLKTYVARLGISLEYS